MQCAAVNIQRFAIIAPPHECLPFLARDTIKGNSPSFANSPPAIRSSLGTDAPIDNSNVLISSFNVGNYLDNSPKVIAIIADTHKVTIKYFIVTQLNKKHHN